MRIHFNVWDVFSIRLTTVVVDATCNTYYKLRAHHTNTQMNKNEKNEYC